MKRKYLAIGLMALALKGKPQAPDTSFQKRTVSSTAIELVFSSYLQDGDHSAITGGSGTEELSVYAPSVNLTFDKLKNTFSFSLGGDIITSASTDRIDTIVSSASKQDLRTHARVQYNQRFYDNRLEVGIGTGFSIESDYLSIPVGLYANFSELNGMRTYHVSLEAFFDDLRWGRLNPDYRRPVTLIYPSELRYKEWYGIHNRYSYNLKTGISQTVNKRLVLALNPEFIYQHGLLATPFHRVYFTNDSLRVENFPKNRFRFPISVRANYFAGSRTILKPVLGFYTDNFGITSGFVTLETILKISPTIALGGYVKGYRQSASRYFEPYGRHNPANTYYTSDYDLSNFTSLQAGASFRWAPFKYISRRTLLNEIHIRYAFLHRGDGLQAHTITGAFLFGRKAGS